MTSTRCFYHYTSTAGANAIRNDGTIPSRNGIKLSTLKPEEHTRSDILHNIYGRSIPSDVKNEADNVVIVAESILDASKLLQITPTLYDYSGGEILISAKDVMDKPQCIINGGSSSTLNGSLGSQRNSHQLYYYTNQSNATAIKQSGLISYKSTIYLTTMRPEHYYRDEILNTIYGNGYDRQQYAAWADWCIKIDGSKLDANKLKQNRGNNVYEYTDSIKIVPANVMDKPQCNKAVQRSVGVDEYLYHYTNTAGALAIKAAGYLKKSGSSGAFGVGVYMTNRFLPR